MTSKIILGTRGSDLALWQARYVQAELAGLSIETELKIITTKGDRIQDLSFDKIEGKGFFTKEIEDALLAGEIDLAVHSMKDLPTTQPLGLRLAAVSYRENPADWLLIRKESYVEGQPLRLGSGAVVGTSSARRKAQVLDLRPDLQLKDLRGNVPTRVQKLRQGQYDAILLAAAGLSRLELDLSDLVVVELSPKEFIPAPAQGVLALQIREEDQPLLKALQRFHKKSVAQCTNVERKVLHLMEGGCHMPLGVYCEEDIAGNYRVWAAVAPTWDSPLRRCFLASPTTVGLAEMVLQQLKSPLEA
jgi:hydroxymethylbilane synthase